MKRSFSFYGLSKAMSQYLDAEAVQQNGLPRGRGVGWWKAGDELFCLSVEQDGFFSLFLLLRKVANGKPALLLTQSCRRS